MLTNRRLAPCRSQVLFAEIIKLRPDWAGTKIKNDDGKEVGYNHEDGAIRIIMTGNATDATDIQQHVFTKRNKKRLEKRFKDPDGHANELKRLLESLGYHRNGQGYRHADRKVVFVGDLVYRGPAIGEVVEIARAMVDAGDALAVMGNHEYNAIAFDTPRPGSQDKWFRPHSEKNLEQHQATLDQLSQGEHADAISWFETLPVAIEIGGIRVAHASWQTRDIDCINDTWAYAGRFTPDFLGMSEDAGSDLNAAIENVLKGPQLQMPDGHWIVDKAGHRRDSVRIKWHADATGGQRRLHRLQRGEGRQAGCLPLGWRA